MSGSKTIVKNSLFLYFRMFLSMGVGLYTSRVILNTLGVEDYGVYNIVGGVVTLFGFFNAAMSSATQRFLSFDIGKGDESKLNKTFNATLNIHFLIAIVVLILTETLGLWFVNNKLNVPVERMNAVNWVYQFSILTFLFGIIQVPYSALIIARERMNIYAYISIFETVSKLLVVYVLVVSNLDKLKLYAVLLFLIAFLVRIIEIQYCKKKFKESKYEFYYDKSFYKVLLSYSGWNLFGNIAAVARGQGSNILLNLFFGTVLNAAYGISMQIQATVQTFFYNFQMAVNPQIIKLYAAGDREQCAKLIFQSAKFSYYLMFLIICPIIYNIDFILDLWLENAPKQTSTFVVLCLINLLIECLFGSLNTGIQATGNIKWFQITVGTIIFMCLPISYTLIENYNDPKIIFIVIIILNSISLLVRLLFLKKTMNLNIELFITNVLFRIIIITVIAALPFYFINTYTQNYYLDFFVKSIYITIINLTSIYFIGISSNEKSLIISFLKKQRGMFSQKNIQQ